MFSAFDHQMMARALTLARSGLHTTDPNPRVGCVIVQDQDIIGEGAHLRAGEAHAEVFALQQAGERANGATAYVTLEPCAHTGRTPPCTDALIAANVAQVVIAMLDPDPRVSGRGVQLLRQNGIEVKQGLMQSQALRLNVGFVSRITRGRPWVRLKLASSLDGGTAMASGESHWISSAESRDDVQHWRARASAIMTGVGTVLADDPSLTVRAWRDVPSIRIILDSHLRTPPDARLWQDATPIWIFSQREAGTKYEGSPQARCFCVPGNAEGTGVDLTQVMQILAREGVNELHLECGATLAGAMQAAGLVDELLIYVAPIIMGDQARGLFTLPGLQKMAEVRRFSWHEVRQIGPDIRLRLVLTPIENLYSS